MRIAEIGVSMNIRRKALVPMCACIMLLTLATGAGSSTIHFEGLEAGRRISATSVGKITFTTGTAGFNPECKMTLRGEATGTDVVGVLGALRPEGAERNPQVVNITGGSTGECLPGPMSLIFGVGLWRMYIRGGMAHEWLGYILHALILVELNLSGIRCEIDDLISFKYDEATAEREAILTITAASMLESRALPFGICPETPYGLRGKFKFEPRLGLTLR